MRQVFTLVFISIYFFGLAQPHTDSIFICKAHWKRDEKKILLIRREKEDHSADEKPAFVFSYEAHITILDSSRAGYKIKWIFHLPEDVKKATPGLAEAMPVYEGLNMVFTTTTDGDFEELINWEEVRDAYVKMMEVSLPKNLNAEQQKAVEKSKELFSSKQMVESALIPEIQLYYSPYASIFTLKGSSRQTSLPNPFSSEPIPAVLTEKISELPLDNAYIKTSVDRQIDKLNGSKIFEGLFRKMGIPEDSVLTKAKNILSDLVILEHTEYLINRSNGWIAKINSQKTAKIAQSTKIDSFTIEIKKQ